MFDDLSKAALNDTASYEDCLWDKATDAKYWNGIEAECFGQLNGTGQCSSTSVSRMTIVEKIWEAKRCWEGGGWLIYHYWLYTTIQCVIIVCGGIAMEKSVNSGSYQKYNDSTTIHGQCTAAGCNMPWIIYWKKNGRLLTMSDQRGRQRP